jgi:hypothetical protein
MDVRGYHTRMICTSGNVYTADTLHFNLMALPKYTGYIVSADELELGMMNFE